MAQLCPLEIIRFAMSMRLKDQNDNIQCLPWYDGVPFLVVKLVAKTSWKAICRASIAQPQKYYCSGPKF
eukprot:10613192-Ditylum_brightwellii.AAC.1